MHTISQKQDDFEVEVNTITATTTTSKNQSIRSAEREKKHCFNKFWCSQFSQPKLINRQHCYNKMFEDAFA